MRRALIFVFLLTSLTPALIAAPSAELRGILKDQEGNPVANLAFSLIRAGIRQALKSDQLGNFVFKNLVAGEYAVQVESSRFRPVSGATVTIKPGESAFLTVILQQVFDLDQTQAAAKNDEIRTILRNSTDGRLIFRNNPNVTTAGVEPASLTHSNGVVELFSGNGWGNGDFSVFPVSSYAGMLTNFAYAEDLGGSLSYVLAGQFASGEDALWKVRNSMHYRLGKNQNLEMLLGYTRLAFNSPNMVFVNEPSRLGQNSEFINAVGSARVMALGVKHSWNPSDVLSLAYGLELERLTASTAETFASPMLEASWRAWRGGGIGARVTSKRMTRYNTLLLPNGNTADVADALYLTKVGDTVRIGTNRHYEINSSQQLGSARAELSLFVDQLRGGSPYLVFSPLQNDGIAYDLPFRTNDQRGVRAAVSAGTDVLNYGIDYVYGSAFGFDETVRSVQSVQDALRAHHYHAVTGRVQTTIPRIHTVVAGVVRVVPGKPLTTVDLFHDSSNISNQSVNLFVRQVIPFPDLLGFSPRLEALIDLRNVLNQDIGLLHTELGDVVIVRNPRTVRGGISVNF
ncbi:MAG TPA: carboxypeptidase-like regulatory domain-containing protein [Acidobacteriota bacterium]|jgi:hypothetical protein